MVFPGSIVVRHNGTMLEEREKKLPSPDSTAIENVTIVFAAQ